MGKKIVETKIGKIWLEEDYIVYIKINPGAEVTIDDVKEMQEAQKNLIADKKHVTCADIQHIKSITKTARDYAGSRGSDVNLLGSALIIGSPISRVIGNIFMRLNKPDYPTKLFTDKEKALKWLKEFLY